MRVTFIDDHRGAYGVEPICRVVSIAPSTYYEQKAREANRLRLPRRLLRDGELREEIERVWKQNHSVYGARKVWLQRKRQGFDVARCTVERLMAQAGLRGAVRGRGFKRTAGSWAGVCRTRFAVTWRSMRSSKRCTRVPISTN